MSFHIHAAEWRKRVRVSKLVRTGMDMHEMWLVDLVVSTFFGMVISGWVYDKLYS